MPAFFSRNVPSSPTASYPTYSVMVYNGHHSSLPGSQRNSFVPTFNEKHAQYKGPNPSAPMFQPQQQQTQPVYEPYSQRRQEPLVLPSIQSYDLKPWAPRFAEPELPKPQEEPAAGGLVKHLDYDIGVMTDYLFDTTLAMYGLRSHARQVLLRDHVGASSNRHTPADYRDWLRHVLSATRLPSTTIFIALNNLVKRMELPPAGPDPCHNLFGDVDAKKMFIISLVVSSKYADDSTFINRSWAEVAKMDVRVINELERDWLGRIGWRLDIKFDERIRLPGWEAFHHQWKDYELNRHNMDSIRDAYNGKLGNSFTKLTPINTNVARPSVGVQTLDNRPPSLRAEAFSYNPSERFHDPYASATTTGYNESYPWNPPRSGCDSSPDSAPYTGPTTPEYYIQGSMGWGHAHSGSAYDQQRPYVPHWTGSHHSHQPSQHYAPSHFSTGRSDEHSYPWNSSSFNQYHHNTCAQYPYPPPPGLPQPFGYYQQAVVA